MAPSIDANSLKTLASVVENATALVTQLSGAMNQIRLSPTMPPTTTSDSDSNASTTTTTTTALDALALARDASSLAKAHATKISLLIINEPFTPSAISTVVRELTTGPIPAIATAVQVCDPTLYTSLFRKELAWRCDTVLKGLKELLENIPKDGKVVAKQDRTGFGKQKGSLAYTGLLWSAADDVIALANLGVAGFFVKRVQQWRDTLQDVMEELKEWGDEEPESDDDEDEDDTANEFDGEVDEAQQMLDNIMNTQMPIPRDDPASIRPRLESSLRRLRLVLLLYQAVNKRRIKKLPALPASTESNAASRLDEAARVLSSIPERFSDLVTCFYVLDAKAIDDAMDDCFLDAYAASELLNKGWNGEADEFSTWAEKFQSEIKKV